MRKWEKWECKPRNTVNFFLKGRGGEKLTVLVRRRNLLNCTGMTEMLTLKTV